MQVGRVKVSGAWLTTLTFAAHTAAEPSSSWLGLVAGDADGCVRAFDVSLPSCWALAAGQAQEAAQLPPLPPMGRLLTSRGALLPANLRGAHALSARCVVGSEPGVMLCGCLCFHHATATVLGRPPTS